MIYATFPKPRGFTLLVSVIFSTVVLSVGLALADVAYKQVILASNARQSEYAFYAADAALECALYADQKQNVFYYNFSGSMGNPALNIVCEGYNVTNYAVSQTGGNLRTTSFTIPCTGGTGTQSSVIVYKNINNSTTIDASGFNTCNAFDPNRVERGVKASY
jgi:Tfp pilus assembly protein PilX